MIGFNIKQVGVNTFYLWIENESITTLDIVLQNPCENETKSFSLSVTFCNNFYTITLEGVSSDDEDLPNGKVNFDDLGTWTIYFYDYNDLLDTLYLQVVE